MPKFEGDVGPDGEGIECLTCKNASIGGICSLGGRRSYACLSVEGETRGG